jgi:hypothetical protein
MTKPRKYGGLGVRDARLANILLLGKLVWHVFNSPYKLWVNILQHKYLNNNSWFHNPIPMNSVSYTWKSIHKAFSLLWEGFI